MSLVRGQQSDTESAIVCVSEALIGISSCSIDAQACCLFCVCKFDQTCAACAGQQSRSLMQQSCVFRKSFASHPLSCLLIVAHPPSPLTPHVLASNQDPSDSNRVFFENRLRLIHCFFLFHYLLCCLLLTPHSPPAFPTFLYPLSLLSIASLLIAIDVSTQKSKQIPWLIIVNSFSTHNHTAKK